MKKIIGIILSSALVACGNDSTVIPVDTSFLVHQWKVISVAEQVTLEQATGIYIVQFLGPDDFSLTLDNSVDVNACSGRYHLLESGRIEFTEGLSCTKVCCDSDFARKLIRVIPRMSEYSLMDDTLVLSGKGRLQLLKIP